jgi:lipid II:glycine glycyltransferase (peptidoglycan interpeptide bridge formation enzyme)
MPEISKDDWDRFLARYPDAHLLQSSAWGELKAGFGWEPTWVAAGDAGAQVLFRRLPLGYTLAYIPKGPLGENWAGLWPEVDLLCRARKAVFLKVEQDTWEGEEIDLSDEGFLPLAHAIQPLRTQLLDISDSEDEILGRMKQKTRYNIRLAGKKEVVVKPSADIQAFSSMMDVTGQRDDFGVHSLDYYQRAYDLFHPQDACELLVAEYEGQPLAGLMVFAWGKRAWYLYGASTNQERNRMPTYLLQWEAIRWAKEKGCTQYDLWGVPDEDDETLEANFTDRNDGLWGVYRFKRGFGGEVKRAALAWDKVYNPILYFGYQTLMARRGGE